MRTKRFLDKAQIEALLGKLTDTFRPVAASCMFAGPRISEALGLRWQDVDFEAGQIRIAGQLGADGSLVYTKTLGSTSTVPLLPALARELQAHRARVASTLGLTALQPEALVFQTQTGQPQSRRNAFRAVQVAALRAKLGEVGLHDLRRSFLSLAAKTEPLAVVQQLARHSSVRTTSLYIGSEDKLGDVATRLASAGVGA